MLGLLPVTRDFGFSDAPDGHLWWDSPGTHLPSGLSEMFGEFAGSTLLIHSRNLETDNMSDTVRGPHPSMRCCSGQGERGTEGGKCDSELRISV